MSKIIITGSTGNAGSAILTHALSSSSISRVITLSRRSPYPSSSSSPTTDGSSGTQSTSKLTSIIVPSAQYPNGFDKPVEVLGELEGCNGAIWALGISQNAVNKEDYIKITHDYTLKAAQAFKSLPTNTPSTPFRFIYISGEGADQSESTRFLFGKIKGRTERALMELEDDGFKVISIRPGAIIPTQEHTLRMGWLMRYSLLSAGSIFNRVYPSMIVQSADLARVAVDLVLGQGGGWEQRTEGSWLSNVQLRGLSSMERAKS